MADRQTDMQAFIILVRINSMFICCRAREYDELIVELYDDKGFSIAEQLTVLDCVDLVEYEVQHDTNLPQKIVVP